MENKEKQKTAVTGCADAAGQADESMENVSFCRGRKRLINAPYISQKGKYPTGCESISAVMLLQYLGYDVKPEEFIAECLEKRDFEEREGVLYGPDPREYFCGDPYDEEGMGCYAPVMVKSLDRAFGLFKCADESAEYFSIDESGKPLRSLIVEYIDNDMPVLFWACINMREPIRGPEWHIDDRPDEIFTWISNEHCMLLVGYDEHGCWFNDPYDGNGVIRYPWDTVEARHAAQHSMAVGVKRA